MIPYPALLAIRDTFYFFGGTRIEGPPTLTLKSIMSLNPVTKKWKHVGNMNSPRFRSHSAILKDNLVFIAGYAPKTIDSSSQQGLKNESAEISYSNYGSQG